MHQPVLSVDRVQGEWDCGEPSESFLVNEGLEWVK